MQAVREARFSKEKDCALGGGTALLPVFFCNYPKRELHHPNSVARAWPHERSQLERTSYGSRFAARMNSCRRNNIKKKLFIKLFKIRIVSNAKLAPGFECGWSETW